MTKLSKKVLLPMAALSLTVVTGMMVVQNVSAAENQEEFHPMIQSLVDRFNLNPDEVEAMMEEHREARQAQRRQYVKEKLDEAEQAGKLTPRQRQLLLDKMVDHQAHHQLMHGLSPEERRRYKELRHQEMENWAEANGIDLEDLDPMGGAGMHGPRMGQMGEWANT